jgi:hypothetical protein
MSKIVNRCQKKSTGMGFSLHYEANNPGGVSGWFNEDLSGGWKERS